MKRDGDNLKIYLDKNSKKKSADIVIEDYYKGDNEKDCLIIGKAANGKIYAYVPESGDMAEAVTVLQDTKVALQVLGGEELSAPFWSQAFNPVWLGLGALALGGLALAAGGGSSGSSGSSSSSNTNGSNSNGSNSTVTDANNNGVADITDVANANKAIKEAQDAAEAAKEALAKATEDGLVTPEEAKAVEDANKALEAAKDAAAKAIDAVPEDKRGELTADKEAVDALTGGEVPDVTDANKDGVKDSQEAIDANKAIKEAQDAAEAAKEAAANADKDGNGVITPEEAKAVEDANKALEEAKEAANKAIDAVPADKRDELTADKEA
ncbi:GA-like domain-containing protein, partial [Gallibacterium anatis]|uniref:GA-like domain-containing protein n=1 Tax=Gallibacterium anatis TaxID=750 RepID=UPI000804CD45